jgi:hypothetical protein
MNPKLQTAKTTKIDPSDERFGQILISAVRYALGRMTYIVDDTAKYVEGLIPQLSDNTLQLICKDITRAEELRDLGMGCDRVIWLHLREEIVKELGNRSQKT